MVAYTLPLPSSLMMLAVPQPADDSLLRTICALFKAQTITGAQVFSFVAKSSVAESLLDSDGFAEARKESLVAAKQLEDQWKAQVLDRGAPVTANALSATVYPLFEALSRLGPGAVDLRGLPADEVNGVHLAVVLRATLAQKDRTPGWDQALAVARDALRRDRLDESDALLGLI